MRKIGRIFTRWCRMNGTGPLPPSSEMIGLYLADLASGSGASAALSLSTIEHRLSGLGWNCAQRRVSLDRKNRHIATVLAGCRVALKSGHPQFVCHSLTELLRLKGSDRGIEEA